MRMDKKNPSISYWIDFFEYLFLNKITKIHISDEYDSYKMVKKIFSSSRLKNIKDKFQIIIKCNSPNFEEERFNVNNILDQIKKYKKELGVKKFYIIQWLWRGNLYSENQRIKNFLKDKFKINRFINLVKKKYTDFFFSFPYSERFVSSCVANKVLIDGFTLYLNQKEKSFYKFLKLKKKNYCYKTILRIRKKQKKKNDKKSIK